MRKHEAVYALNAGGVDTDALARIDLEKMRLAGEHPVAEFLPMVLGPATLRPGSENLVAVTGNAETRMIRFQRSVGTSYMLLFSPSEMRVMYDGAIVQVPAVATAINSGSWSDVSVSGATATGGATLSLSATATAEARLRQTLSVSAGDTADTHIIRIVVSRGPIRFRVGTTAGGQEVLSEITLEDGTHKVSFVPGATTVYVDVRSSDPVTRTVSSIQFESTLLGGSGTGDLVLPTPWSTIAQIEALRFDQSIDVMFLSDGTSQQRRIEHRGLQSWGLALYKTDNGPFVAGPSRITMTPAALSGNTTITASDGYFKSTHVGALMELTQTSKTVTQTFNGAAQTSDYITVVGISSGRIFYETGVNSAFIGTLVVERSFDVGVPVVWSTYTTYVDSGVSFARFPVNDGQNNVTIHYRFRVTAYTSGSCAMTLEYESGVQVGRARITGYTSTTEVSVEVLRNFGNTSATRNWRIGDWSDLSGWPRTPVFVDSRLNWFRDDTHYGSVVDDYSNFDDEEAGDSAPFTRSVGAGGGDGVLWAISDSRLVAGTMSAEVVISASELDEPLTQTAYTVRNVAKRGCADIRPAAHDEGFFYVQRSSRKLFEISRRENRYKSTDVSRLNPEAYRAGIVRIVVQQQPDCRNYALLEDGSIAVLTFEPDDKVTAITTINITGGTVEDIEVLNDVDQDDVYLIVNRGGTRYIERLAKEDDQRSVSTCSLLDGHKTLTGSISSITGATHFANQTVQVWADGQRRADVALNGSGVGALGATYSRVVYGKSYSAVFKSVKLAYAAQLGSALNQTKTIKGVGLIVANSCMDGIRVGRDASNTDPMPAIINGAARTTNQFFEHEDIDIMPINSEWDTDARVYVSVNSAEGPCTLQGITFDIETRDGAAAGNG